MSLLLRFDFTATLNQNIARKLIVSMQNWIECFNSGYLIQISQNLSNFTPYDNQFNTNKNMTRCHTFGIYSAKTVATMFNVPNYLFYFYFKSDLSIAINKLLKLLYWSHFFQNCFFVRDNWREFKICIDFFTEWKQ